MASPDLQAVLAAALAAVEASKRGRHDCPFSSETKYRGRRIDGNTPCPVCRKLANGDGGTCTTEIANNGALIELENELARLSPSHNTGGVL
jgi:ribosomal protein L37AE/L43A